MHLGVEAKLVQLDLSKRMGAGTAMIADVFENSVHGRELVRLMEGFRQATHIGLMVFSADSPLDACLDKAACCDPVCKFFLSLTSGRSACIRCDLRSRERLNDCVEPVILRCLFGVVRIAALIHIKGRRECSLVTQAMRIDEPGRSKKDMQKNRLWACSQTGYVDLKTMNEVYTSTLAIGHRRLEGVALLLKYLSANLEDLLYRQQCQSTAWEPQAIRDAKQSVLVPGAQAKATTTCSVAKSVGMSCQHFCRVFKKHTGMTFQQFVAQVRIDRAKQLLLDKELRITDVVFQSGFGSVPHFNRVFRRMVGASPSEYRVCQQEAAAEE